MRWPCYRSGQQQPKQKHRVISKAQNLKSAEFYWHSSLPNQSVLLCFRVIWPALIARNCFSLYLLICAFSAAIKPQTQSQMVFFPQPINNHNPLKKYNSELEIKSPSLYHRLPLCRFVPPHLSPSFLNPSLGLLWTHSKYLRAGKASYASLHVWS